MWGSIILFVIVLDNCPQAGTFEVLLVRLACLFDPHSNTMMFTGGKLFKRQPAAIVSSRQSSCFTSVPLPHFPFTFSYSFSWFFSFLSDASFCSSSSFHFLIFLPSLLFSFFLIFLPLPPPNSSLPSSSITSYPLSSLCQSSFAASFAMTYIVFIHTQWYVEFSIFTSQELQLNHKERLSRILSYCLLLRLCINLYICCSMFFFILS